MNTTDTPRIYVASLADYNAGILHGAWIDADQDAEDIHEEIQAMLKESPEAKATGCTAEEWAIHDYEGFEGVKLSEYEDIEDVSAMAQAIEEEGEAMAEFIGNYGPFDGNSYVDLIRKFQDCYQGEYSSETDYAEQLVDDLGYLDQIPENLRYYFDYEAFARDLFMDGYTFLNGHVFDDNTF